jgi:phage recombination protein Bet
MSNLSVVQSLGTKLATRLGIDADPVATINILKNTAFKVKDKVVSDEQLAALLIVADQYGLNPWTKEIYAFPDKQGGIVPVVGVDGWSRIINEKQQLNGIEFNYSSETKTKNNKTVHEWIECIIYRKDREKPTVIREYFDEVYRELSYENAWKSHPNRFHRHKTLIQCARVAFGFAGIYDEDEADRIISMGKAEVVKENDLMPTPKNADEETQAIEGELIPTPETSNEKTTPAPESQLKLIKGKLEALAILPDEMLRSLGIRNTIDQLTTDQGNICLKWIRDFGG